jgi:hypothetical protein
MRFYNLKYIEPILYKLYMNLYLNGYILIEVNKIIIICVVESVFILFFFFFVK